MNHRLDRRRACARLAALAAVPAGSFARAQTWPAKPVRVVVAFTPGSATDTLARTLGERLAAAFGQPVVVENRPGGGGTLAAAMVARTEPDGHTLLVTSSSHTVTPATHGNLPYNVQADFAGITPLANLPNLLVVSPARGWRTPADLVGAARAKPGGLTYASGGQGSAAHVSAERFRLAAGFEAVHVPYKGGPEALADVMAGRVDFYFCPIAPAMAMLRDGRLAALAVSGSRRAQAMPELPTTVEAGYANSDYNFWVGMFAPARTPREVVARINQESLKALQLPEVRERWSRLGAEPMALSPEAFDQHVREELATMAALVKTAGIRAE
ncbi:tripartite tricarboxylate transporter substrate binding protein [Aquabacterium sp. J223]|uniref:tripartite tricarboxylate transporter substrate binding protein n=1 Tax=Aquabacterium sp. J223 TaxID=2898431 RepID=UPI0021ADA72C|nr:tripartite tricarboxylate transporter substrate binding protein [Aquabacterium sp. J223]UUX94582.1 tripartite tricarboxylate transporter substrate binding protein [Aquabacterium sp. J223]